MNRLAPAGTSPPGAWTASWAPGMCLPLTERIPAGLPRWNPRKSLILRMILLGCTHLESEHAHPHNGRTARAGLAALAR